MARNNLSLTKLHYNAVSTDYDDLYKYRRQYEQEFVDNVLSLIYRNDLDFKDMILTDFGSGTGELLKLLSERVVFKKFLAVEPCASMLDQTEIDGDVATEKYCMDGEAFSEDDSMSYDVATMYLMIHHVPERNLSGFLQGIYKQINPGGMILISSHGQGIPYPFWPELLEMFVGNNSTWEYLPEAVRNAGFEDVTCVKKSFGDVVLPRDVWLHMVRNRFVSTMVRLSDDEIEDGIRRMDYPDPVVFADWQYFIKGIKH